MQNQVNTIRQHLLWAQKELAGTRYSIAQQNVTDSLKALMEIEQGIGTARAFPDGRKVPDGWPDRPGFEQKHAALKEIVLTFPGSLHRRKVFVGVDHAVGDSVDALAFILQGVGENWCRCPICRNKRIAQREAEIIDKSAAEEKAKAEKRHAEMPLKGQQGASTEACAPAATSAAPSAPKPAYDRPAGYSGPRWSVIELSVLLWHYFATDKHPMHEAPSWHNAIRFWKSLGLMNENGAVTDKGDAFIKMLLSTPEPVTAWKDPRKTA